MTEFLRSWIWSLTGAAVVCACAMHLTPAGQVKKVVRLLCGVVMTAALLSPLRQLDLTEYGWNLARYRAEAAELTGTAETLRQSLDRNIIEEKLAAYILDKAQSCGAALQGAQVHLQWSTEGFWYPDGAVLQGNYDRVLARWMEAELGIPEGAQTWREHEKP